jgi:hypothetical protein
MKKSIKFYSCFFVIWLLVCWATQAFSQEISVLKPVAQNGAVQKYVDPVQKPPVYEQRPAQKPPVYEQRPTQKPPVYEMSPTPTPMCPQPIRKITYGALKITEGGVRIVNQAVLTTLGTLERIVQPRYVGPTLAPPPVYEMRPVK